ncbi:NAD-dependent dehydratase [Pseudoalteromonas sp. MSK9-3]|uniref:NAD(P)-dependent oxidoreductase n=1 Tax=Pseudoalteromonas sp. MSK9-3 TaxID=1897633 RepID=UPI000E6C511D|nr:NAD(P)-dependent oxidoreductase [Pseudoalteromonas sp. MSK9-3]RJE77185.1 NAD-dependent dehydratase [Pseudoalteromonas sp. MSK9-3]
MNIAIVGAAGWLGNEILQEAKRRGHKIIALVRDPAKIKDTDVDVRSFDVTDQTNSLADAVSGADVVISSVSGRSNGDHTIFAKAAQRYLNELPSTEVSKLIWVGGAGSLEVAPGVKLVTVPDFPAEYKEEALGMSDALDVFQNTSSDLNWTFVSPAAIIFPGEQTQKYRIGQDALLTDENGDSKISDSDYAWALLDILEKNLQPKQRIGVAY